MRIKYMPKFKVLKSQLKYMEQNQTKNIMTALQNIITKYLNKEYLTLIHHKRRRKDPKPPKNNNILTTHNLNQNIPTRTSDLNLIITSENFK